MSRALETYLVRLYLGRDARRAPAEESPGDAVRADLAAVDAPLPRGRWARFRARLRAWLNFPA